MSNRSRSLRPLHLGGTAVVMSLAASLLALGGAAIHASPAEAANSHWVSCNDAAVRSTPGIVWIRIRQAADTHSDIPDYFYSSQTQRDDISKIICYESSFGWHAQNAGQYGWFQMSRSLIASEGVSFAQYWGGTRSYGAGFYQCTAGERYILRRYGTPANAWSHEYHYGWY
ncbi:MAG: hypothetical protein ACRDZP_08530 [Acidimicrobiales bacterium]